MNYIVFDLEWNQCPDGKAAEQPDLPFEILEIGAIKLNTEKKELSRFHEYVRPSVYQRLHTKTKEILHINQHILQDADTFPAVFERFSKWCGEDYIFCTWGPLDLLELQRNMRYYHLPLQFPLPLKFCDIQKIFSIVFEDGKSRRCLEYAVDFLSIPKDISFHEAFSDAFYTACVMKKINDQYLLTYYSIDYFHIPQKRNEEIHLQFPDYTKYVSRLFPTKSDIMHDRAILSRKCCFCKKGCTRKTPWFPTGVRNYVSLSYCETHGYMKGKIRIRKPENGKGYFCVKTQKSIDETLAFEILERYTERQKKRLQQ
ncbi:MAG: 3'-5' exonuclease [Eubacteriales bacterium]|nr:3'-5' exonuclease [Eubacteriales bacterium]